MRLVDTLKDTMCSRLSCHMENAEFLKTVYAVTKVNKQCAGPFGCCKTVMVKVRKVVAMVVANLR